jgi:hypothetical protein
MQRAMLRMMILFLSIMTLTSACAIRGNGQGVAYVADGTIVVAGVALLAQREPEPNDPVDVLLDSESDSTDLFQPGRLKHELGAAMVITGLVAAGLNLYLNADDAKPDPRGAQAAAFAGAELPPLHAGPGANPEAGAAGAASAAAGAVGILQARAGARGAGAAGRPDLLPRGHGGRPGHPRVPVSDRRWRFATW